VAGTVGVGVCLLFQDLEVDESRRPSEEKAHLFLGILFVFEDTA
jgi:hypothetical protein